MNFVRNFCARNKTILTTHIIWRGVSCWLRIFCLNFISVQTFGDINDFKFLRGWDQTIFFGFKPLNNSDSFDMYIVYEKKALFAKKIVFFLNFDHVISRNSVHRISLYCRVIITRYRGFELYTPHVSVTNVIGGCGTIKSRVSSIS